MKTFIESLKSLSVYKLHEKKGELSRKKIAALQAGDKETARHISRKIEIVKASIPQGNEE